ncbi:RNA polymerase sigma-70 factor (ECF subfamily) [Winogradskyella pacifica]|uniref:RNA polymerase sigma-70 factor (ECF subfamily) n=1 Tax=Winogradskyella pacifica TaxID=664642 RepID=A0A3D9N4E2_9FLAO|nr:RNA polymerase sigma-70 factor [Winogradskyella pacifica]REE27658.1 RNA polymerase sigma-70 factor (ECF subfamily) [Winogradskyella pacifica]
MQDSQLYKAIRNNDKEAFELLFDRHYSKLCYFAMQFSVGKEIAEEVVADVLLKLWDNRKKTEIHNLLPFLYTSVKNATLNLKKTTKQQPVWLDDTDCVVGEETQEFKLIIREELRSVQDIIDQMPQRRRTIFILNRIDGLKYKEIAEILNISVFTVQNQMVEAVKYLNSKYPNKKLLN